jgi:hypothetical protein
MAFQLCVYLVEIPAEGIFDENGEQVFYTVDVKLTYASANSSLQNSNVAGRIRKIIANKVAAITNVCKNA